MNTMRQVVIIIAVAIMLPIVAPPGRALAQDQAKATKIDLTASPALDDHGHAIKGQYTLAATVTTADGRFVGNATVQFVENVEFFGKRSASLGLGRYRLNWVCRRHLPAGAVRSTCGHRPVRRKQAVRRQRRQVRSQCRGRYSPVCRAAVAARFHGPLAFDFDGRPGHGVLAGSSGSSWSSGMANQNRAPCGRQASRPPSARRIRRSLLK